MTAGSEALAEAARLELAHIHATKTERRRARDHPAYPTNPDELAYRLSILAEIYDHDRQEVPHT